MVEQRMSEVVKEKLQMAARRLGAASPVPVVGTLIDRSFQLPVGAKEYAVNTLTPGAVPCEPSFFEQEPDTLRFTIVPLGPGSSPDARRNEATREMRRLVSPYFGQDALRWFDRRSEEWRGMTPRPRSEYGAWFGSSFDKHGLYASKVYYELQPEQLDAINGMLGMLARVALEAMPSLVPIFTSIRCGRDSGSQRVTFLQRGPLRLADLGPLMERLGMSHQLASFMQVVGVSLGGRFDLPERSVLIGLRETSEGPELKLEVMLGMLPDLPPSFLDLLTLGLSERPRELQALGRWLRAFTPETSDWPGNFSVLSIRATPQTSARVSLYLRPIEFELKQRLADISRIRPLNGAAAVA
ncbi:MAG TPA: hypothetical protein VGC89_11810 [Pyrinomonadaceae bacterium]|jgi:hypothetical protein